MANSTLKSPSTSSKRRVSFSRRVNAVYILHLRDYSKKEIETCWHSREDYEAIEEEVNHTIDKFNRSQSDTISDDDSSSSDQELEDSNFCVRGLEHRRGARKVRKAHLRRAAWTAVLDEQNDQYDLGIPNSSVMLREVYSIYSLPARRIAQQRGWKDAIEAGYAMPAEPPMAVIAKTSETASRLPATAMSAQKNLIVSHAA